MPKSGKGRSPPARRSTVDDKHALVCVENGDLVKTAKLASGDYKTGSRVTALPMCVFVAQNIYSFLEPSDKLCPLGGCWRGRLHISLSFTKVRIFCLVLRGVFELGFRSDLNESPFIDRANVCK